MGSLVVANDFTDDTLLLVRDASQDLVPAMLNEIVGAVPFPHLQNFIVNRLTVLGLEKSDAKSADVPASLAAVPLLKFAGRGSCCVRVVCGPADTA